MRIINLSTGWRIHAAPGEHPTAELAAAELYHLLSRIAGEGTAGGEGGVDFILSHGDGTGDSFRWQAAPDRVELHGESPRALLYAVYNFLEALGCRWPAPGPAGERIPQGVEFELPDEPVEDAPTLPGRCLIIAHHAFMEDADHWIIWAARNRLNGVFFHTIEDPLPLGAAPAAQYERLRDTIIPLARERGMTIELGGHLLADLLPRDLFAQMPGAFRYHNNQRTPDHNLCPSDPAGLNTVRRNAQAFFRAFPEADVYHIWPDDIPQGGWCSCAQCSAYTPSEQALLAINAVAEGLEYVHPGAQISFLAYYDTERVPRRVKPRHNVSLLWAPRMRCYAHPIDDPSCAVNVPHYTRTFEAQVAHFAEANTAPPRVFEYYLDGVLFKSVLPPLPGIIQRDLRYYHAAGAHTVQALLTGDHPWVAPQVNAWLFARLAWNPDQDVDALLAEFGASVFGLPAAEDEQESALIDLAMYYRSLEAAYALALQITPEEINLQLSDDPLAVLRDPPADMGDPYFAPPAALHEKALREAVIPDLLEQAAAHLTQIARWADPEMLWREQVAFDLHDAWLRFDLARVRLYDAIANNTGNARACYREAREQLERVYRWGDAVIEDPRYRANFRFMHALFWQLRLDKLYAEHIARGPGGRLAQGRGAVQVGLLLRRLTGIYDGGR
ncbi:MAG TPA: DUF4838 domain-containing protein [Aggregatilineales bacterium]|nr:DUF4838 domain-containing protein [Aggregatilineales bacterium]